MKVLCHNCSAPVPTYRINVQKMVAHCELCEHIFDFSDSVWSGEDRNQSGQVKSRLESPRPLGLKFQISDDGSQMTLKWRWTEWTLLFLIPFTLFWTGGVFFGIGSTSLTMIQNGEILAGLGMFLIPHLWIGIGLLYYCLTLLLNSTELFVDENKLTIKHGPLPWIGNKTVERDGLFQFYSKETNHWNQKKRMVYELHAIAKKGDQIRILRGLKSSEFPLFIESKLEQFWGIQDEVVRGEIGR